MSPEESRKLNELWREVVIARGHDPKTGQYQCFHCPGWFDRDEICADHFPVSKGSDEKVRFDVEAGVPCCKRCNVSDSPTRQASMKKAPPKDRKHLCSRCRIRLRVYGELCIVCVQPAAAGRAGRRAPEKGR